MIWSPFCHHGSSNSVSRAVAAIRQYTCDEGLGWTFLWQLCSDLHVYLIERMLCFLSCLKVLDGVLYWNVETYCIGCSLLQFHWSASKAISVSFQVKVPSNISLTLLSECLGSTVCANSLAWPKCVRFAWWKWALLCWLKWSSMRFLSLIVIQVLSSACTSICMNTHFVLPMINAIFLKVHFITSLVLINFTAFPLLVFRGIASLSAWVIRCASCMLVASFLHLCHFFHASFRHHLHSLLFLGCWWSALDILAAFHSVSRVWIASSELVINDSLVHQ